MMQAQIPDSRLQSGQDARAPQAGMRALHLSLSYGENIARARAAGLYSPRAPRVTYNARNSGPVCEICGATASAMSRRLDVPVWLQKFCLALARKRFHKLPSRKDKPCMKQPQEYATKLAKYPDRVAAILAKTAACKGDAFELDDLEALMRIHDLTNDLDESLIERNANKRLLTRHRPS